MITVNTNYNSKYYDNCDDSYDDNYNDSCMVLVIATPIGGGESVVADAMDDQEFQTSKI